MQSAPNVYHVTMDASGDEPFQVEIWAMQDAFYVSEDGDSPIQLPPEMASLYTPAEILSMVVPPVQMLDMAEEAGEDEIDGRTATRYEVDAETALMLIMRGQAAGITNPEGGMQIWVDEELGVVIRMEVDLTFESDNNDDGSIMIEYEVSDIDDTDDVEGPSAS
jgi:hypothetical protein